MPLLTLVSARIRCSIDCRHFQCVILFDLACMILLNSFLEIKFGLGDAARLDELRGFLQSLYATIIAYAFSQLTIKFSILFHYRRIFQTPKAKKMIIYLLIWLAIYATFCLFASAITCWPIAKYWDDTIPGGCIERTTLQYTISGFNILNDVTLLIFPIPMLRQLQITARAKLVLIGVFTCGAL